tara:strand:- start:9223 stop:9999 length:777 start_codon:yes stop_codon:yes gene_type:complete
MIKKTSFFLCLIISVVAFAQNINLDKYQYIVVTSKFDFLKESDQYQTSSLTKFLLKKKGFNVFLDNENLSNEIANNRCSALFADVIEESGMLTTKTSIQLKDCYGNVIYKSKTGKSKLKEYKKAYQEAIRKAFETMEDFEYSYNPSLIVKEDNKETKEIKAVVKTPKVIDTAQVVKETVNKITDIKSSLKTLYAQSIENGFQLVNTKPEVVFKILKTNLKDVYIITDKNGVFYKVGEQWIAEYYENNQLQQIEYQIKF